MSCNTHEFEIKKQAARQKFDDRVKSFEGLRCPFCGGTELFVHPPGTMHWTGMRTWWTVGCDARGCNSCWSLNEDTYDRAMEKIRFAQPAQKEESCGR